MEDYFLYIDDLPQSEKVSMQPQDILTVFSIWTGSLQISLWFLGRKKLKELHALFWMHSVMTIPFVVKVCLNCRIDAVDIEKQNNLIIMLVSLQFMQ